MTKDDILTALKSLGVIGLDWIAPRLAEQLNRQCQPVELRIDFEDEPAEGQLRRDDVHCR